MPSGALMHVACRVSCNAWHAQWAKGMLVCRWPSSMPCMTCACTACSDDEPEPQRTVGGAFEIVSWPNSNRKRRELLRCGFVKFRTEIEVRESAKLASPGRSICSEIHSIGLANRKRCDSIKNHFPALVNTTLKQRDKESHT